MGASSSIYGKSSVHDFTVKDSRGFDFSTTSYPKDFSESYSYMPKYVNHLKDMNFLRDDLVFSIHSEQEDYEIWEPKLPTDCKQILHMQRLVRGTPSKPKRVSTTYFTPKESSFKWAEWIDQRWFYWKDPISQEKRYLEMRKNAKMEKAAKSISEISLEVDRLAGQVKRVQKYVETLDVLKIKNSMIGNTENGKQSPLAASPILGNQEQRNSNGHGGGEVDFSLIPDGRLGIFQRYRCG